MGEGSAGEGSPNQTASGLAAVTFGPNFSGLLPRSRVLSLLRSDCRLSSRRILYLVLHCSDTTPDQDFTIEKLKACHKQRGFGNCPGYHLYIRRDGTLYYCRPVGIKGCHVKDYNSISIGICYEGGRQTLPQPLPHREGSEYPQSRSKEASCSLPMREGGGRVFLDTRTPAQKEVLEEVFRLLHECYPLAKIVGHCELNSKKACPCLNPLASVQYQYILNEN